MIVSIKNEKRNGKMESEHSKFKKRLWKNFEGQNITRDLMNLFGNTVPSLGSKLERMSARLLSLDVQLAYSSKESSYGFKLVLGLI